MVSNEASIDILNDLVQINNDRIEGYEKALKELSPEDSDLRTLFTHMISESHKLKLDLANEVQVMGASSETGTTTSGKIYRAWMDLKAAFTGHDRKSILENCVTGEDAAQKAYNSALEPSSELPAFLRDLVSGQQQTLQFSHDKIKALRDLSSFKEE